MMSQRVRALRSVLAILPILAGIVGCNSYVDVKRQMIRPAEINMAGRERVVLSRVNGQGGDIIGARLRQALSSSGFTVVSRGDALVSRRQEDELHRTGQTSGSADGDNTPRITRADIEITGQVLRNDFAQAPVEVTVTSDGIRRRMYRTEGIATVEVAFNVIDLSTTETVASKTVKSTREGRTDVYSSPPHMDPSNLLDAAHDDVVSQFMRKIRAHTELIDVRLYKVKDAPDNDGGIADFQLGQYAEATRAFQSALKSAAVNPKVKAEDLAKFHHNIGVAEEFANHLEAAMASYREAHRLNNRLGSQAYSMRCQQRQAEKMALRDQGIDVGQPPAAPH